MRLKKRQLHLWLLCLGLASASGLHAANPYRILVTGDSISVGYTDLPNWSKPFNFGARSGLYTRLTNSGMAIQFVGGSAEPWNGGSAGTFAIPTNTPALDLRPLGQDYHEGYGGKKTDYILPRIAGWLTNFSPDIVLVMIGINDISSGATAEPTTAEANLSNIVHTITTTKPATRVVVAQVTPYATYTAALVKYNTYIRDVLTPHFAGQGKFVTTVNQYTNLCSAGTTNIDAALFSNGINHPNAVGYDRMAQTWYQGIQALLPLPPPQPPPDPFINGSFESPAYATNSHNINPTNTGWNFTPGATGAGSGIDCGNPYGGASGSAAFEGAQQAFLQGSGEVTSLFQAA